MEIIFGSQKFIPEGTSVNINDQAKNFVVIDNHLQEKNLDDFQADYIVISVIPSIDTGVCSHQTRTFNEKLSAYDNVQVLTISNDLPFAQKRWCANEGLDNIITLSDHRTCDFALKYGVLLKPLRLLTRAVFILDSTRKIIYKEIVPNASNHPSYETVTQVIEKINK